MSELSKQALKVDNNTSFPNNNTNYITPAILRAFNVNVIDSMVDEIPYQAFTQSILQSLDSLDAFTASMNTSSSLAVTTASFDNGTRNLTFTKGDTSTFSVNIPDASGSSIPAGTISGSAQITALGFVSSSVTASTLVTASFNNGTRNLTFTKGDASTFSVNIPDVSGSSGDFVTTSSFNAYTASNDQKVNSLISETGSYATTGSNVFVGNQEIQGGLLMSGSLGITYENSANVVTTQVTALGNYQLLYNTNILYQTDGTTNWHQTIPMYFDLPVTFESSSFFTKKAIFAEGIEVTGSTSLNTLTASLAQGYTWVGDSTGKTTLVATSSFGGATPTGTVSSSAQILAYNIFATTGSNVFTGDQTLIDAAGNSVTLTDTSGSLMLVAKSFTSASAHLTSSVNQVNLIIKSNNTTADTVLSGSNNIIANPTSPTSGFRRYVTNANLSLQGALPQLSSSMGFSPTINGNLLASSGNPFTIRGPVSSSAYNILNNILATGVVNLGTAASTNFEKANNGLNFNANIINGTVNVTAYKTNFISSSAIAISSNNIGGAVTLNADSSSITLAGNTIQNSTFRVDNSYYNASATGGGNSLSLQQGNAIFGTNSVIYASGSNTTAATGRQFIANIVAGTFNSASVNLNGDNSNIFATAIIGHGLNVTGSSALQTAAPIRSNTYGSAFFGRHNAQDGTKALTAETVFAVGTGTTTTPKTGFLIDSGSNTFVEGTLNVSGSSTFTGSITIQSGSGDLYVHGHKQFNGGMFQNNTTLSGSAGVSQSIALPVTDLSYGVTVANSSQITVANAGVYNIQFSAQIETQAGADTVYIWYKKNGTNVTDSATKVVLANNTAQTMTVNILVDAAANDYYELVWQSTNGNAAILSEAASGNIPLIPAVITTVTQLR